MTFDLAQARKLRAVVRSSGKIFVLTHNYTGNAMVKQARALVRDGTVGTIRKVVVEYPQGWLADAIEKTGQKQASWRTDPKRSGAAGAGAAGPTGAPPQFPRSGARARCQGVRNRMVMRVITPLDSPPRETNECTVSS